MSSVGNAVLLILHAPVEVWGIGFCYIQGILIQAAMVWTLTYWCWYFLVIGLLALGKLKQDGLSTKARERWVHIGIGIGTAAMTAIPAAGYGYSQPAGTPVVGEWCWVHGGWTIVFYLPFLAAVVGLFVIYGMVVRKYKRLQKAAEEELSVASTARAATLAAPLGAAPAVQVILPSRKELIMVRDIKETMSLYLLAFMISWLPGFVNRSIELGGVVVDFFLGFQTICLLVHQIWCLVAYGRLRNIQKPGLTTGTVEERTNLIPTTPEAPPPPEPEPEGVEPFPPPVPLPIATPADVDEREEQFASEIHELREGQAQMAQQMGQPEQLAALPPTLEAHPASPQPLPLVSAPAVDVTAPAAPAGPAAPAATATPVVPEEDPVIGGTGIGMVASSEDMGRLLPDSD
eukprot:GAFH01001717.1.p1 GENE.GAFH01001717.1~~GAFH01001717.1.p1  ORF type:complete len:452 (-),score=108.40 GAFH01001717.1:121-1329(-)